MCMSVYIYISKGVQINICSSVNILFNISQASRPLLQNETESKHYIYICIYICMESECHCNLMN